MFKLVGINSLVTGGSRGIGLEISKELAKLGSNVCIVSRNGEINEKAVKELPIVCEGQKHFGMVYDLSQGIHELEPTIQKLKEMHSVKAFNIYVHSAGIIQSKLLLQTTSSDIQSIMNTNTISAMSISKSLLKDMVKERYGRIVLVSSVLAATGFPGESVYSASKSALIGFSKSLAQEMNRYNITCNLISPGYVDTDMIKHLKNSKLSNISKAEDVAKSILPLLDRDSAYNGKTVKIQGDSIVY
ncbi:Short-chain dehydrogenase/reductase (SDR) superfamily [Tieghemostelium lacteum]|uniref:Short-chain dehydrogenase/reductase (SDR) superfamily n=1 Tax=Tieghemostelium lacteum TaxID=361077 RepID=A0A152A5K8_TIELA|nr:Short-chain dehydrogenase/reductase (SDR) superfamily [Tieghemostelium lacteum]|eukprot:KYR01509.1 Short-chain dehydrogenase/reductase (SDR) superfamily [Tieghemostelium lacteum]